MKTIVAISTPFGSGGIAVIRVSGHEAIDIVQKSWKGADLHKCQSHTAHFGRITASNGEVLDEAIATLFRSPNSFTGEDTVELSVHGSKWIQRAVVERLIEAGAFPAEPGEFTKRAFINGRMDLAQAEAVADVIASSSRAAHKLAISQLSGGFSKKLNDLRQKLIDITSLLELELDFSEEDVEFADRQRLLSLTGEASDMIKRLATSYKAGRAFKEGVPVAIAGSPNAGKSTLLNALLDSDKAIVSDIPGTTRDVIEDTAEIGGILFRFFDTAGLRDTSDTVERIGIDRAREAIGKAAIVLWVIDLSADENELGKQISAAKESMHELKTGKHLLLLNKSDVHKVETPEGKGFEAILPISAKQGEGLEELRLKLAELAKSDNDPDSEIIVTNERHFAALRAGAEALGRVTEGMEANLPGDLIAQDMREAIHHLSTVTGEISTDTLLSTIFSRFCIGK